MSENQVNNLLGVSMEKIKESPPPRKKGRAPAGWGR